MRKSISLILAIVMIAMVFATIPFTAFAADETTTTPPAVADNVIAQITGSDGTVKHEMTEGTFESFSAKAEDGDTVTLYKDVTTTGNSWFYGTIIFDGNGKTMTYTGTDYAICGANTAKDTGYMVDAPAEMDTLTVKNLNLVGKTTAEKGSAGGFKFYNSILHLADGNVMTTENVVVLTPRSHGKVIVSGGIYNAGIGVGSDKTSNGTAYPSTCDLEITGGIFNGGVTMSGSATNPTQNTAVISGGVFKNSLSLNNCTATVTGGISTVGATVTGLPEGAVFTQNVSVVVGDAYYATLAEAITAANAATEDVTINLLSNAELTASPTVIQNANGKVITIDGGADKFAISIPRSVYHAIKPLTSVNFKNLTINHDGTGSGIQADGIADGSTINVENVVINATGNPKHAVINTLNPKNTSMTLNVVDTTITVTYETTIVDGTTAGIIRTGNGGNNVAITITNSTLDGSGQPGRHGITVTSTGAAIVINNSTIKGAADAYSITKDKEASDPKSIAIDDKSVVENINENVANITKAGEAIAVVLGTDGSVKATLTDAANFQEFVNAAGDGDTIKLYQNIELNNEYDICGSITLDGNGKTITFTKDGGDFLWTRNTNKAYGNEGDVAPEGDLDTFKVINLKFVATGATGGFARTYNNVIEFGEGNDIATKGRWIAWDANRGSGAIVVTAGNYSGTSYLFSVANKGAKTAYINISGGTFTCVGAGIVNIAGNGKNTISGGTFKASGETEKNDYKVISIDDNATLDITGGTFTNENPLAYVLALRDVASTVTVNGANVEMYGKVLIQSNNDVLNLTAGKLDGVITPDGDITATVNKAEGFNHIDTSSLPEVYYQEEGGELIGLSFSSALTEAGMAMFDVTITLNKNVVLESGVGIGSPGITVTIKGNGNTITAADGIGNVFQITGNGTTLAIENAKLTGKPVKGADKNISSCFFQIKGDDAGVSLKDVTAYDIEVMYHFINAMGNNGSAKYVTFDNVTTKNITGTNASISALIQTGNRQKTTPGGDHTNYSVVVVKNSNLEHWRRIIECSEGSAYNVLVENSTLTILEPGDQSAVRIYPVCNLLPAEKMPQSGRVVLRDVTYNVPEGGHTVKYDTANNLVVIEETPEDVVAQIVVEDGTVIDIKRNEFATKFARGAANNITASEQLKGKAWTLNILADLVFANDTQMEFYLNSDKEIVINGDPNGLGINAKITSAQGGNPLFRLYENGSSGKITFKNLDRDTTSTMMQIYTNMAEVNFENCVWTSTTRGITIYGGSDTTANFKAGSVFTSTGGSILYTNWGWTAGMITVEEGATISCADLVNKANANYGNIKLKVNGGTVIGNITADAGMYMLLAGKLEGDIIIPETEDGLKLFLDEYICSPDFVVTGTNDFAEEIIPETTEPGTTGPVPGTTVPGTTDPVVPGTTEPGTTDPVVPGTTEPGTTDPVVPGTTTPDGDTTTAPAGDKPAEGCAGCGGFSIAATFLALICAAGAALVIKKK